MVSISNALKYAWNETNVLLSFIAVLKILVPFLTAVDQMIASRLYSVLDLLML